MSQDATIANPPIGILSAQLRILSLRFTERDLVGLGPRHLVYGLLVSWAVGIGRYWDHPHPYLLQSLGLGSLAVMSGLVLLLYVLLLPLRPERWSLSHLFTFVSLTALPALLYAIPVERFMPLDAAREVNLWFLAVVALWRVLMLGRYLGKWTDLSGALLGASLLLPLSLVVVALTVLNLEQAVFDVMSGLREDGTAGDTAYQFLFLLSAASFLASPILALIYGFAFWSRHQKRRESAQQDAADRPPTARFN
ncbi:MAG: hypothetical protein JRH16_16630 [Deltaproteobacteria bacterium]|nr:hypothetical protein [Deltaproteobacteria bacterium]